MGYRDIPCAINNAHVGRLHDLHFGDAPDIPTRIAVQRVGEVLQQREPAAYGLDREGYIDILLDMTQKQQADLVYALLDAEHRAGILAAIGDEMREKVRQLANDEVTV
ncbi:MAG TPA: hypothetical protein VL027_06815 [Spongiibacteraceae bacterium]|nr:hypothetical protein [Spongiibacteraceae bacterium]